MTDPVTEARDALLDDLGPKGDYYPLRQRHVVAARIDNLIALVRAEAGVSVEALAKAMRQAMYLEPGFRDHPQPDEAYPDLARGVITALAARSAGSGSRVEYAIGFDAGIGVDTTVMVWGTGGGYGTDNNTRPTPPPAVDGWTFEALTGDGWAILPPPSEDFPEDDPRGDWQASGYGSAIAYRREDAVRIVNALNAARALLADGERSDG